jgi:type II secretory pathway component PulC
VGKKAHFFEAEGTISLEKIRMFNAFLLMVFVIVLILFVSRFFIGPPDREEALSQRAAEGIAEGKDDVESMPIDYYSNSISKKDVFASKAAEEPGMAEPEAGREEAAVSFALVGIISGDEPQAIIEDTKQNKRMFIKKGQESGGIFLKDIGEGSVTIVFKGKEINLSL